MIKIRLTIIQQFNLSHRTCSILLYIYTFDVYTDLMQLLIGLSNPDAYTDETRENTTDRGFHVRRPTAANTLLQSGDEDFGI